jgi:hypothetical protein
MNDARFILVLPSDLKERAAIAARKEDLSLAAYMRRGLRLLMETDAAREDQARAALDRVRAMSP